MLAVSLFLSVMCVLGGLGERGTDGGNALYVGSPCVPLASVALHVAYAIGCAVAAGAAYQSVTDARLAGLSAARGGEYIGKHVPIMRVWHVISYVVGIGCSR